ncbi:MAG: argininosuccinate synthase [Candidatus Bathyarchaeia archaeon]
MKGKVVLAYSGGLDTSCMLRWLIERGHEVVAYVADVGQREDFSQIESKALSAGASKVYIEDLKEEFVRDFIFPAIRGNAIYEGRYMLGTALSRPLIAKRQVEIAHKEKADYVAHGATGKGNDQIRFELSYAALDPDIKVIAPWKDENFLSEFQGRSDLIEYAERNRIPVEATKKEPWSKDSNLMHVSYEAGELEDPYQRPHEAMFEWTKSPLEAPDRETLLEIEFRDGDPVKVVSEGGTATTPLNIMQLLNEVGAENGVGRVDIVENRFVGIKSRGVYETPGGTVLHAAHRDIEGLTMDREVMRLRDLLAPKYAELIYYGFWFSPEMQILRAAIDKSQEGVSGKVRLSLYKGNVVAIGRSSPYSLYSPEVASMEIHGGYDQKDASGFIRLNALRLKMFTHRRLRNINPPTSH